MTDDNQANYDLPPETRELTLAERIRKADTTLALLPLPKTGNTYSTYESWCYSDGSFNPALLAYDIVQNFDIKTDSETDILYFYDRDRGIYDRHGDTRLRIVIDNCLKSENREHRTRETTFLVHSRTLDKLTLSLRLACENGLLDPKTKSLMDFTPVEFVTFKIPIRYDPKVDCPAVKKFLSEIMESDQIPIAQEWFGYCLLREYPIHTSLVLLGQGANGKTTFLNLLNAFLGPENCSHITLQQICEGKFELAQLCGKLANVCDDLPGESLKSVGNFKNLTGNGPITAQYKHKNPFDFLNTAKLSWACNKLPAASEDTIAYYRRFVILQFTRHFIGANADINLIEKLTTPTELSGLLNFALEGLERLLKNKAFSTSQTIDQTRQQYIRTADSCLSFIEERTTTTTDPRDFITDDNLYQGYVNFCNENKLPIQKKGQLTISLQKNRPEAKRTMQRVKPLNRGVHGWQYLVCNICNNCNNQLHLGQNQKQNLTKEREVVTSVTSATGPPERTCGQCASWHKTNCSYPNGESSCIAPENKYAAGCRGFILKKELS